MPDAQIMALEIYHELDFMLGKSLSQEEVYSGALHKLTIQVDKKELSEFIKDKKEKRKPSPRNANGAGGEPPFAEDTGPRPLLPC